MKNLSEISLNKGEFNEAFESDKSDGRFFFRFSIKKN